MNPNKPISLLLILFAFCGNHTVMGQSALDQYIELGLKSNQKFLQRQIQTNISKQQSKILEAQFYPNAFLSAGYFVSNGGRTINLPLGDLFNPVHSTLNDLNGNNQFPTNLSNVNEQFLPNDFHDTKIRIVQPLLNMEIYYQFKASQSNISVSMAQEESYKNQLRFEITKAYYNYLKALEQRKILKGTKTLLNELVGVNAKFIKYDIATKDVLYNAESQLFDLNAQLASLDKEVATSQMYFNALLNRNLNDSILVDTTPSTDLPLTENIQQQALDNRSEIKALENSIDALEFQLKKNKKYVFPNINVTGDLGYQGFGYKFNGNQEYYLVNLNLTWPIFQGNRNRAEIKKTQFSIDQVELQLKDLTNTIELQVKAALLEYTESHKIYEAQLASLKSAKENFKIIQSKYRENQVPIIEFNEARTNYTNAQIKLSIAKFNIRIAEANFKRTLQL